MTTERLLQQTPSKTPYRAKSTPIPTIAPPRYLLKHQIHHGSRTNQLSGGMETSKVNDTTTALYPGDDKPRQFQQWIPGRGKQSKWTRRQMVEEQVKRVEQWQLGANKQPMVQPTPDDTSNLLRRNLPAVTMGFNVGYKADPTYI
jgi:hypothetical protein